MTPLLQFVAVWDINIRCYKYNWSTSGNGTQLQVVEITTEALIYFFSFFSQETESAYFL